MKIRTYTTVYKKNSVEIELHEIDLEKRIFRYTVYKRQKYFGDYRREVNLADWKNNNYLDLQWKKHPIEDILRSVGLEGELK